MNNESNILSYENTSARQYEFRPNYWLFAISGAVGLIGVAIMLVNNLTHARGLPGMGMLWLLVGFVSTSILGLMALVNVIQACFATINRSKNIVRCILVFLGIMANFPIAFLCVRLAIIPTDGM